MSLEHQQVFDVPAPADPSALAGLFKRVFHFVTDLPEGDSAQIQFKAGEANSGGGLKCGPITEQEVVDFMKVLLEKLGFQLPEDIIRLAHELVDEVAAVSKDVGVLADTVQHAIEEGKEMLHLVPPADEQPAADPADPSHVKEVTGDSAPA